MLVLSPPLKYNNIKIYEIKTLQEKKDIKIEAQNQEHVLLSWEKDESFMKNEAFKNVC